MASNWIPATSLYLEEAMGWLYLGFQIWVYLGWFRFLANSWYNWHHFYFVPGVICRLFLYLHGGGQRCKHHHNQQGLAEVPRFGTGEKSNTKRSKTGKSVILPVFVYFGEEEDGKEGDGHVDRGEEGHHEDHVLAPFLDQVWLSEWKTNVLFLQAKALLLFPMKPNNEGESVKIEYKESEIWKIIFLWSYFLLAMPTLLYEFSLRGWGPWPRRLRAVPGLLASRKKSNVWNSKLKEKTLVCELQGPWLSLHMFGKNSRTKLRKKNLFPLIYSTSSSPGTHWWMNQGNGGQRVWGWC